MNMNEHMAFFEGFYAHGARSPQFINGTVINLGAGSHGETLYSSTYQDPFDGNKTKTTYGAYRISQGEANVF